MVGSDDFDSGCVSTVDDFFYDIISGKDFNINEIYTLSLHDALPI